MENIKILQVVGYKNSGKTTLVNRFILLAKEAGKKVSTIKHHGHGGAPDMPTAETDSMQFLRKGAASSLVYGDGVVQLHLQEQDEDLEKFIDFSVLAGPDLLLIEGFKGARFPKIVLVRNSEEWQELKKLSDVRLVVVHKGVELENTRAVAMDNQAAIDSFFAEWMEGAKDESI
jgi:molybdopterin-guanine dinucleotide biosynthesis protein B